MLLSGSSFLYSSFVYSCHFFLIFSAFFRSMPFLPFFFFFCTHLYIKYSLVSVILLKRSLVFPILLFSSISCIIHLGKHSYLSLLFFVTLHSDGCTFPFLLCVLLLFFTQLFIRPPQPFCLFHFLFLGMVFITTSYTMSWTFVHSYSGTLSIRSDTFNLFVPPTVYSQGVWFR